MGGSAVTRFRLHADGTFDVLDGRRVILARALARVVYRDANARQGSVRTATRRKEGGLYGSDDRVKMELRFAGDSLWLEIQNSGDTPIYLETFDVLDCDTRAGGKINFGRAADLVYLHHGWQSWSKTEMRPLCVPEIIFDGDDFLEKHLPYGAPHADERTSNAFTLLAPVGDENALLFGFETGARQFSQIRFSVVGDALERVRATAFGDGACLDAGAPFESARLLIRFGDANTLYQEYATRVAAQMPRRGKHKTLQGWCSWYYYYGENTAQDIRANVEAIRAQNLPLNLIVIDDGYQTALGDWTSIQPEKFSQGMHALADEIHAAGKMAGIWVAPFGAGANSQLARAHPEFFLRDENGNAVRAWTHWGEPIHALDLTRADVGDWLYTLFQTICGEWDFDAVKLDFLFAGALAGKHFDTRMTRAQAYRRGMEIIAQAIGDEKIIMGCGAPQLASVGLVDSMRVSQDVNFTWAPADPANGGAVSTQHAVQNTLLRAPFNQRWWLNDPDCVMVRRRGDLNAMTQNETRTLASIAALAGSVLLDSDNLTMLDAASWRELARILPALEHTARVRRWFSERDAQPSELELKRDDGTWILAALNWSNRTRTTTIRLPDARAYRVLDFWKKKDLGIQRRRVKISKHAPHQTVVLHCVPVRARHSEMPSAARSIARIVS